MKFRGLDVSWTAEDLARHTQAVLQGGVILAKVTGGPNAAIESINHVKRYIELLFGRSNIWSPLGRGCK